MSHRSARIALAALALLSAAVLTAWSLRSGDDEAPSAGPPPMPAAAPRTPPTVATPPPAQPPRAAARSAAEPDRPVADPPATVEPFEDQHDLAAYVRAGLAPGAPVERVVQAKNALWHCDAFLALFDDHFGVIAGGGPGLFATEPVTQPRRDAIAELQRRCGDLAREPPDARERTLEQLRQRLRALGAPEADLDPVDNFIVGRDQLIPMLDRPTGAGFFYLVPALNDVLKARLAPLVDTPERASGLAIQAALIVTCELTRSCSATGFATLWACANGGYCDAGLVDGWRDRLPDDERALVDAARARLVQEIARKDWAALGLR